jgi:hypothetical protein
MRYSIALTSACLIFAGWDWSTAGAQGTPPVVRNESPLDVRDQQEELAKQQSVESYKVPYARGESLVTFLRAIEGKVPGGLQVVGRKVRETDEAKDQLAEPLMNVRVTASRRFLHVLTPFVRVTTAPPVKLPEQMAFRALTQPPDVQPNLPPKRAASRPRGDASPPTHVVSFEGRAGVFNPLRRYLDHSFVKAFVAVKRDTLVISARPDLAGAVDNLLGAMEAD